MAQFAGDLTVRRGHGSCFRAPVLPATANAIGCGVLRLDKARHCADPFRSIATVENLLPLGYFSRYLLRQLSASGGKARNAIIGTVHRRATDRLVALRAGRFKPVSSCNLDGVFLDSARERFRLVLLAIGSNLCRIPL
jgi:hypothetical protein